MGFFAILSFVKVFILWQKIQKEVHHRKVEDMITKDYTVTL